MYFNKSLPNSARKLLGIHGTEDEDWGILNKEQKEGVGIPVSNIKYGI